MHVKEANATASKDQTIGAIILAVSLLLIVVYLWWLFGPIPEWLDNSYPLGYNFRFWAILLPVLILVIAVLAIVAWIGYTMATTPPPKPLEEIPELSEAAEKKEGAEEPKPINETK
uniref:Uncharacterized protein n=1 Tax=Candidatus Methanomethylicus mesodigestus TaxID=1867258 RepID=A0A7C3F1F2_9CREN